MKYAPPGQSGSIVTVAPRYENFIGGKWLAPTHGNYRADLSPATARPITEVAHSSPEDVELALDAAHAAKDAWGEKSATERAEVLNAIADAVEANKEMLAVAESWENGKPVRETLNADVPLVVDHFRYFAAAARSEEGSSTEIDKDLVAYHFREPLGVVGQIIPFNFPLLMAAWKLAPALAAGNTCVLKPAETTPLTALLLAEVCQQAGLPPGVVNVLTGAGDTGAALVGHPGVRKIAFTGSTEVGKQIATAAAGTGKKLTLELGGKAANIVFDDAPMDQAIEGIVGGIFFNQGHVCCAGSRLLVQESVAEPVLDRLRRRLTTLRLGDPLDKNTDIGAINSRQQLDKIRELSDSGAAEGAERWSPPCQLPERGYWFPPTIFTGVSQSHRIAREEIFGPVLSVLTFRTPAEAVAKANNTPYGLSAGVWTDKGSRILWMSRKLRAGVVWANTFNKFDPASPFGGYRESGYGREGGRHGLAAYLDA
jgi:aldehyde dehydrogenase (NAD+)